jgi:hypothetical protein
MFNELAAEYERLIGERAAAEGVAAFCAGHPRHAPARFGTYSGRWVDGYDNALIAAESAVATVN